MLCTPLYLGSGSPCDPLFIRCSHEEVKKGVTRILYARVDYSQFMINTDISLMRLSILVNAPRLDNTITYHAAQGSLRGLDAHRISSTEFSQHTTYCRQYILSAAGKSKRELYTVSFLTVLAERSRSISVPLSIPHVIRINYKNRYDS